MTYTETAPTRSTGTTSDGGLFARRFAAAATGLTTLYVVMQIVSSRADDRASIREDWLQDGLAVLVASAIGALIAYAVAVWARRGGTARCGRAVVGLTVFGALLAVPSWWNAAPAIVLAGAVLLGSATGVTQRGAHGAARVAANIASVLIVALVLFLGVALVEVFA